MTAKLWQNQKGNYQVLGPSYMLLISRFLQTYLDVCAGVCLCVQRCAYDKSSSRTDYQTLVKVYMGYM